VPPIAAVPSPTPAGAKTARLPTASTDQEGIYEGLLWAVRALEECGRAFTRLSGRLGKVEARLASLEADERPSPGASPDPDTALEPRITELESRLTALCERLASLETDPRPVQALRPADPQLAALRKELIAAQVRIARLEGADDRATRRHQRDEEAARALHMLSQRMGSLERDVVGVYRELDKVAERVADRLAAFGSPLDDDVVQDQIGSPFPATERFHEPEPAVPTEAGDRSAAVSVPQVEPPPPYARAISATSARDGSPQAYTTDSVRERAASVLTAELVRILQSLDALGREDVRPSL
jgi:hypothetical protein